MKDKKNILFIVRSFGQNSPQPIRFKHLISHIDKECYNIHVLYYGYDKKFVNRTDITLHYERYNYLYRKLFPAGQSVNNVKPLITKKSKLYFIKKFVKNIFFPDPFILEYFSLRQKVLAILKENKIKHIVGSAHPFSIYMIGPYIKSKFPGITFVMDLGDPFYKKEIANRGRNWLALHFESFYLKYVDKLIVVSGLMEKQYLETFKSIDRNKISVVEQGFNPTVVNCNTRIPTAINKQGYNLIYAGRFYQELRNPRFLLKALNKHDNFRLDVYGYDDPSNYEDCRENISFKGVIANDKLYEIYSLYDIIVFIDNMDGIQIPGKLYELLSLKIPIMYIYDEKSPCRKIMENYNGAICVYNSEDEISLSFQRINKNIINFSFEFDSERYTWSELSKKILNVIN